MSTEPVGLERQVDPFVADYRKRKRDAEEWHRRVKEWQETVDQPLDRFLVEWRATWNELAESWRSRWPEADSAERIADSLLRVAARIRELEAIRVVGQRWIQSGAFGHFGVAIRRLDWCRERTPLDDRTGDADIPGMFPPTSFRLAVRAIELGLQSPRSDMIATLRDWNELPDAGDAAVWFPFFHSILPPLQSMRTLNDAATEAEIESELREEIDGIELPAPSERLSVEAIREGVVVGLWGIGRMQGRGYDWLRSGLRRRLDPRSPEPTASGNDTGPPTEEYRVDAAASNVPIDPVGLTGHQNTVHALLQIYTGGLIDEQYERIAYIVANANMSAGEKLNEIDAVLKLPPTASAETLGDLLSVTKQAIQKTTWWIQNRKGVRKSEIGKRQGRHQDRAKRAESPRRKDDA